MFFVFEKFVIFVYLIAGISNTYGATVALVISGILSNLTSVYLAYLLYVLQDVCVVCVATYLVNAVNLILAIQKYAIIASRGGAKKRKLN